MVMKDSKTLLFYLFGRADHPIDSVHWPDWATAGWASTAYSRVSNRSIFIIGSGIKMIVW